MISFYNSEAKRIHAENDTIEKAELKKRIDNLVNNDPSKISWTRALKQDAVQNIFISRSLPSSINVSSIHETMVLF